MDNVYFCVKVLLHSVLAQAVSNLHCVVYTCIDNHFLFSLLRLTISKVFVDNMYFCVKEPTDSFILVIQLVNS